jgi:aspartate aminotransferase
MKPSTRLSKMQESPIRKLVPIAEKAKKSGKKIYHLNIGQPDIETPAAFLEAIKSFDQKTIAYSFSQGEPSLIRAMIGYYEKHGIHFAENELLVTNGGSEALLFSIIATTDPGDEILVPEPFYTNYNGFSLPVGVTVKPITTSPMDGFRLPDLATLESYLTPKTKTVLLSNPGNPTGVVYTRDEVKRIAELAIKHDLFIIADEVYREFVYDGFEYTSFASVPEIEDRLLLVDSISKRFSACGARIGLVASKNHDIISGILKLCMSRLCVPTLEQIGAEALYSVPQTYFDTVNTEYRARRDIVYEALNQIDGVVCEKPRGAFYVVAKLPVDDAEKFAIWLLEDYENNGESVMFAPAAGFYATPGLGVDEVRIAYILNQDSLKRAMAILDAALKVYPGRKK